MHLHRVKYKDLEEISPITIKKDFKDDFIGSSPAPFIGRFGYPNVNVGILSPQYSGDMTKFDSPRFWSQHNFPISSVASLRYGLVNSRSTANIKDQSKFIEICQEISMARKAPDVEVSLKEKPQLQIKPEKEIMPFGPQGEVKKARLTSNATVDSRVERVVQDTDLKAADAILNLYQKGFEESFLNKILSVGNLGLEQNRKLVPTKWSITAVDNTVGKELIKNIKEFPTGDYAVYFGGGWGNYYLLLFFPEVWSYELFETHLEQKINPWSKNGYAYSTNYEPYEGRKTYADECAGGYYAARLAILEKMKELKRQHSCLALRFITSEYNVPLGVWVCREAARKSTQEKPLTFGSEELMLHYAQELIKNKFGFDLQLLLKESKLLQEKKTQTKLSSFLQPSPF